MKNLVFVAVVSGLCLATALPALADAAKGQGVYMNFCAACHDGGIAGAPKLGDKDAWKPRLAKGDDTLVANAIKGFQGSTGFMPAKGGVASLSDEEVAFAVQYMLGQSR